MAWLSGYDQRIKLTIDHTKIDADLSWFPVTVFLTSSQGEEVFDELDADEDFDRIAFTLSDGETQLYADCELFDVSEQKAIYHVSKSGWTVSSSTDTDIYLYYDNTAGHNTTYISKSGGTAAQSVWDSNFEAVYHMNDGLGSELITNGDFASWSGDNPTSWTIAGTENGTNYVTEDNGKCNIVSDGGLIGINQRGFATSKKYSYSLDIVSISGTIVLYDGTNTIESYNTTGTKTGTYTAANSIFEIKRSTACNAVIDNVSVKEVETIIDATSNANHGTKKASGEPAEATGKVGQGQDFDGSNDYIDIPNLSTFTAYTVEALGKFDVIGTGTQSHLLAIKYNNDLSLRQEANNLIIGQYTGSSWTTVPSAISASNWYHAVGTWDGSNIELFVDGISKGTTAATAISGSSREDGIGSDEEFTPQGRMDGIIDEVRISSTARSAAWIKATYHSLWDTLLTYGSAEMLKNVSETLHAVDTPVKSGIENISETLHTVDTILKSGIKALAESFNIFDSFFCLIHLTETLHLADSLAKSGAKQLDEVIGVIDSILCKIFVDEVIAIIDEVGVTAIKLMYETLHIVDWFWAKLRRKLSDWTKIEKDETNWTKEL